MKQGFTLAAIYNSVPTIPYEGSDAPIHTRERPYCSDLSCPCHEAENPYHEGGLCEGCTIQAMME